jgi:transcriptional regulator with XRE-family HTH domain
MVRMRRHVTRLRKAQKLSRYMLAQRAGIARSYLTSIEEGRSDPSLSTLVKLAKALGVPVTELLG